MLIIFLYIIILAASVAQLELQIEGKKTGWAQHLPCWRIENQITDIILGNKPLTGYHVWLLITLLFAFHNIYLYVPFTIKTELQCLGYYSWFLVIEDFCWFLENRYYGLKNFKKGRISWHKRFVGCLPLSYWWGIAIGTLLLIGGLR
jgi:hypothetical protein